MMYSVLAVTQNQYMLGTNRRSRIQRILCIAGVCEWHVRAS